MKSSINMKETEFKIPTYVINLKRRTDRRRHIKSTFKNRSEFQVHLVEAIESENAAEGLWKTISSILLVAKRKQHKYVLVVEDDHFFTSNYTFDQFRNQITNAIENNCDILVGGVSWFNWAVRVSPELFYVNKFNGTQFLLIFEKAYSQIILSDFVRGDNADFKISYIVKKVFCVYPFISMQKDFGYSDVTARKRADRSVTALFGSSELRFKLLGRVYNYYEQLTKNIKIGQTDRCEVPIYLLQGKVPFTHGLPSSVNGFNIRTVHSSEDEFTLWKGLKRSILDAMKVDDDFIVVCRDISFAKRLLISKHKLTEYIVKGSLLGIDILFTEVERTENAIPIVDNLIWVDFVKGISFAVIYKQAFNVILREKNEEENFDDKLSAISSNKALIYPFVSNVGELDEKKRYNQHENNQKLQKIIKLYEHFLSIKKIDDV